MKRQKIRLKVYPPDGHKVLVDLETTGYTSEEFPGLAVHRGLRQQHGFWYVSHMDSGYRIHTIGFSKRYQAVAYAKLAATVQDWTAKRAEVVKSVVLSTLLAFQKEARGVESPVKRT